MKKFNAILVCMVMIALVGCTRIGPGHVGVKISMAGDNRGASQIPITTGWAFYVPGIAKVFEYPTFVQTTAWTKDVTEGSPTNEEICFNTSNNINACVDISLSYSLAADRVPDFYVKFRSDDLNSFTHGFYRNIARDAFNEIGARYTDEEVSAEKKSQFLEEVRKFIVAHTEQYGIKLEQLGFIGSLRVPHNIQDAMNNKVASIQKAKQSENELAEARADAAKLVAKAQGEAEANRLLTASLTPELIAWRQMEIIDKHWNGEFPLVTSGGSLPTLSIQKQ